MLIAKVTVLFVGQHGRVFRAEHLLEFWCVFRWDISVICLVIVLKLAVTMLTSLYFRTLWSNWLNFFRSFQKNFGLWPKKKTQVEFVQKSLLNLSRQTSAVSGLQILTVLRPCWPWYRNNCLLAAGDLPLRQWNPFLG